LPVQFQWVQARVDSCGLCQKFKADLGIALRTARHVLVADNHRSQISVDVCGMEEDELGNKVCFVITNHNTKLIYLYAASSKGERETLNALLSFFGLYGIVDRVLSDEGGEFTGSFTQQLMDKMGISWKLTITERPQAHGTERSVGKVLDAVRIMLVDDGQTKLNWSEPAVLATTSYLLNSEINDETGHSAFDLTFGKDEMTEFPDISGTPGKPTLQLYLSALQDHLDRVRAEANVRRKARQVQRQTANTPPGDHHYQSGDLVFIRRDALLRERKFIARNQGPFAVVKQDEDGGVHLRSLIDSELSRRHHNQLRIFEGTLESATELARMDNQEELIKEIDDYSGSVYLRSATTWAVRWHDESITWETYATVEKCTQLTEYAKSKPYLFHRYTQTGKEFSAWCTEVNKLSYQALLTQDYGFMPPVDKALRHPFALAIQYFDKNNELQETTCSAARGATVIHKLTSSFWNSYLTAFLVCATPTKFDVFVPALSTAKKFKKFPVTGAYVRALTACEILQFARALPIVQNRSNYCADHTIHETDFPARVWPEQWDLAKSAQSRVSKSIVSTETEDQAELDEGLLPGEHTGRFGTLKTRGKKHKVALENVFPNGDYLCVFEDDTEARVPFSRIHLDAIQLLKRRGEEQ